MSSWTGYMDGYLRGNLTEIKKVIKKDWDMVFIVDGREGSGKSVIAQQCAKFVDESFNINRIAFNPEEFMKCINDANKYEAVIYDEAMGGLSSRSAISDVNKALVSMLSEIRQKNLYVFIVLPCFFELDKYAAIWRSCGLIHVYTGENFERGRFTFYNYERKKDLYVLGKKFYKYSRPPPNFRGSFTSGYAVDEVEYRKKKAEALNSYTNKPTSREEAWKEKCKRAVEHLYLYTKEFSQHKIAEITGIGHPTITEWLKPLVNAKKRPPMLPNLFPNLENVEKSEENI